MNGVTMGNYPNMAGVDGLQLFSALQGMPDVMKALEATGTLPRQGPGIDALGVEDVSATMASAEYLEEELIFWGKLKKLPAYNLIPEFSRLDSYGRGNRTGFMGGSSSGNVIDPRFARGSAIVKYMGEKYETDLPTQLVELIGPNGRGQNAMSTNRMAAMGRMLRNIERNLFFSDTRLDDFQWKGLAQWIDEAATLKNKLRIDMRGGFLNRYVLAYMSQVGSTNHANPTDFFVPNEGYLDLQLSLFPEVRRGDNIPNAAVGQDFDRLLILLLGGKPGYMKIERIAMLSGGIDGGIPRNIPDIAASEAPTAPSSVSGAAMAHTATDTEPGLGAATYYYSVSAIGEGGETLSTSSAGVVVTDGQKVRLSVTDADEKALFYNVFRNKIGDSGVSADNRFYMGSFKRPSGSVTTTWDDTGYHRPDTYHAFQLTLNPLRMYIKQLMPVLDRMLPQGMMTNQRGLLYFATPIVEEPTRQIHLVNCGRQPQVGIGTVTAGV